MPLTPLHYPLAYAMRKAGRKAGLELDMAGLAIGSFTPDVECPFFVLAAWSGWLPAGAPYAQYHRLVLHSLLGSVTLGSLISMLLVLALYRLMKPEKAIRPGVKRLYLSCSLGNLSHVLLDAVHHHYNPLLYPFTADNVLALVPFRSSATGIALARWFEQARGLPPGEGCFALSTWLVHLLALLACLYILVREREAGRHIITRLLFEA